MKKPLKYTLIIIFSIIVFLVLYFLITDDNVVESTTENTEVISKGKNSNEHWIVLAEDKKIFIEDFNTWSLIEENQHYTINYSLRKKTDDYHLTTIVPRDYNGQF